MSRMSDERPTPMPWWRLILFNLGEDAVLLLEKFAVFIGILLVLAMLIAYAIGTLALVCSVLAFIGAYVGLHAIDLLLVGVAGFAIATLIREITRPADEMP